MVFAGAGYYMGKRDNVFLSPPSVKTGAGNTKITEAEMMSESMQFVEVVGKISPEKYKGLKSNIRNYDTMTREQKVAWMNDIAGMTAVLLIDRIPACL